MAKWDRTSTFRRRHKRLDVHAKAQFREAVQELNTIIAKHGFDFPRHGKLDLHSYSGFTRPPAVWSMDFGPDNNHRALFTIRDDIVMWEFIGTHEQIERWQKEIGPRGLRRESTTSDDSHARLHRETWRTGGVRGRPPECPHFTTKRPLTPRE